MSNFETKQFEGKLFNLGKQDCFTAVKDFYSVNFGIEMPDFARPNDWIADEDDLIAQYWPIAGFKKLDVDENWPPRPADLLVCTVGGSTPNHLIIYLGGNEILHHKANVISSKEMMRPAWRRYAAYMLRHPDVPDMTEKKQTRTLMEVYDAGLV